MWKALLVAALLLLTVGCSAGADRAAAEQAVARFRTMVEAGQHAQIYAGAANEFKQAGRQEGAIDMFRTIRDRLGPVQESQQQGWRVDIGTAGRLVSLTYNTRFRARPGDGAVSFSNR